MIITAERRTDGFMNAIQVLDIIRELSHSQGFYSRLYRNILDLKETNEEAFEAWSQAIESENFEDPIDVVMYFES